MQSKELNGKYGLIILAAGRSERLGSPKQLLSYQGKNLLQHTIDIALESRIGPVMVVMGASIQQISPQLELNSLIITENPNWESGMASSIVYGLHSLLMQFPDCEAVILMVCDQPHVNKNLLKKLIKKHEDSGSSIVASSYINIQGTPALFHKKHFDELSALKGDTGARSLIKRHAALIESIPFELGSIDIDTMQDYRNLLK
jgi:molybdenum cofactor cytidylyltransferase